MWGIRVLHKLGDFILFIFSAKILWILFLKMKFLLSSFVLLLFVSSNFANTEPEFRPRPRIIRQFEDNRPNRQNQRQDTLEFVLFCEAARALHTIGTKLCSSPQLGESSNNNNNNPFGNRTNNNQQQFGRLQQQQFGLLQQQQQNEQGMSDLIRQLMCQSIEGLLQMAPPECQKPRTIIKWI